MAETEPVFVRHYVPRFDGTPPVVGWEAWLDLTPEQIEAFERGDWGCLTKAVIPAPPPRPRDPLGLRLGLIFVGAGAVLLAVLSMIGGA